MVRSPAQIPLYVLFAHNAWATERLLSFCESLSEQQLAATAPGAVGNVFDTLHHYIQAECGYLARLAPDLKPAHWTPQLEREWAAVRTRANEAARCWSAYAVTDPDASAPCSVTWPDVRHTFPAGMEIAQALGHSHAHREQICTILTTLGVQPPDLSGLAWGDAEGLLQREYPQT